MHRLDLLWPRPRTATERPSTLELRSPVPVVAAPAPGLDAVLAALGRALGRAGLETVRVEAGGKIKLVASGAGQAEGSSLSIDGERALLVAKEARGLFRAVTTLGQWMKLADRPGPGVVRLPGLEVRDEPDFAARGVMLDVSRDKVPTLETLFALVDRLASWKIDQLQLYTEHTFAYRGHDVVWRDASPLTADEVRSLDAHCRDRFVELVANQNSFGHFHRWLRHEPYRPLAEVPEGVEHPFGDEREPFSLCPLDPGSLALLGGLYDQLLPNFTSGWLNVGCDETFDLGRGRSATACAERGKGRVYLEFLQAVHRLAAERGRRIQFWGDVVLEHPELIPELPNAAVALEWGYEAGHPFADHGRRFAASGLDFYVCPGTSSWNSLGGRVPNALSNLAEAARHGRENGASGYLITDWGDFGHLQPLPISWPGLLAGAGFAWNEASADPAAAPWAELLDLHAFDAPGAGLGQALLDLGEVYRLTGPPPKNGSALFHLLLAGEKPLAGPRFAGLGREGLEAAEAAATAAVRSLGPFPADRPDLELAAEELSWVADLLAFAARLGQARLEAGRDQPVSVLPSTLRHRLGAEIPDLLHRHQHLWLARNRPGGLPDSQRRLVRLGELLGV